MAISDQAKKSLLVGIAASFVLGILFVPYFVRAPLTQGSPALLVPLGTNQPAIGANLYLPDGDHIGKVVELEDRHEFPDGIIRPGAMVKPPNALAIWVPLETLTNAMVRQ